MNIDELIKKVDSDISEISGQIKEKSDVITKKNNENTTLDETFNSNIKKKLLLQQACDNARKSSYDIFTNITTNGLKSIFAPMDIKVEIVDKISHGVPNANFMVRTKYNGYETFTNPTDSDGGGVADIVSLCSFIAMNIIAGDKNSAPIFLDEPTKFVSAGHAQAVAEFLKEISKSYGKQIIMVTHAMETKNSADSVFFVELDDEGKSIVKEVLPDD